MGQYQKCRQMKKLKVISVVFFSLLGLSHLVLVIEISQYLFASTGDMHNYAFDQVWTKGLVSNYTHNTGRWGQGISNDYRFYEYKEFFIPALNLLFLFSSFFLFKRIFPKSKALILSILFYFTISVCSYSYYYHFYYLPVANSYTIAFSLSLLLYSYLFIFFHNTAAVSWKKILVVICSLLIIAISGLVEVVSIPVPFVLVALLFYQLIFSRKLSLRVLLLFGISVAGFLFLFFSPGNTRRRNLVESSEEFTIFDIDYGLLFKQSWNLIEKQFGVLIFFLIIAIYLTVRYSVKNIRFSVFQKIYISIAVLIFIFLPMLVGFLASNGTVGMAKVYNFFTLHLILGGIFLIFVFFNQIDISRIRYATALDVFVFAFAFVFFGSLFFKKNNIGNSLSGLIENKIQGVYVEEQSRRHLLISNNDLNKEQKIPNFSETNQSLVFNLRPFNNQYMPKSYRRIFNQGHKVFSKESTTSPNGLYGAFLTTNENASVSYEWPEGERAYFISQYNILVLEGFDRNCEIKIRVEYKTPLKTKTKYYVSKVEDLLVNGSEFGLPIKERLAVIDIPFNTTIVRVFACSKDYVDITDTSKINEIKVDAFEKQTTFSIMN